MPLSGNVSKIGKTQDFNEEISMYIKLHKGLDIGKGRCFGFFRCDDFTMISFYFFHIRIMKSKQDYEDLGQCG